MFSLEDQFPKWDSSKNHLWQILKYLKFLLEDVEMCMDLPIQKQNLEAVDLFKSDTMQFYSKIKTCVEESELKIYDHLQAKNKDLHYITFDHFNPDVHKIILREILCKDNDEIEKKNNS